MLNRWSVNFLLKSVIAVMSAVTITMLTIGAWSAYRRLELANRVAVLTDASGSVFRALNNLRLDRSFTDRSLKAETVAPSDRKQVSQARAGEMPALKAALTALRGIDFVGQETYIASLQRSVAALEPLQAESAAAFDKPKADRRADLGSSFVAIETDLIDTLDKLGVQLAAEVKLKDAFVDEMLTLKQLGWIARSAAGDASVTISNSIIGGQLVPNGQSIYTRAAAQVDTAWAALGAVGYGTALPANYVAAVKKANDSYFAPDLVATRDRIFKELLAGQKPDIAVSAWTGRSVPSI